MKISSLVHRAFFTLLIIGTATVKAQILTTSSLPIVIVNTGGNPIPDEPKINATMGIIDNGPGAMNHVSDPFNHYSGNIGIETRGNSTQGFDKKTFGLETWNASLQDTSVSLLGMGTEEDWILHGMVIDKSHLRIPMSFYLSQRMGHYAPNWRFVELVLDGDYRGLYILTEKIKRDNDRVDIAKLDEDDLAGDSLTGGYILRIDWLDYPQGFQSGHNSMGGIPMFFQWYYPRADRIKPEQKNYIENWMSTFESAVFAPNHTNAQGVRYTDYINLNSFTDFLLINELSKNSDGYKLSSYVHKDRDNKGGKLVAGPIWDFDQTYGVSEVCSNADPTGWTYLQNQDGCEDLETMPMWWQEMMDDDVFKNRLKCRWDTLRMGPMHLDSINAWIDDHRTTIASAIDRNFLKWTDFIGEPIWAEPEPIPQSYDEEITVLKSWIANRIAWLDQNMPGDCSQDVLSIADELKTEIRVYPNPAKDRLNIAAPFGTTVTITNGIGQIIKITTLNSSQEQMNVSNFTPGLYSLSFNLDGKTFTKKLILGY